MYRVLLAIDADQDRAERAVETVLDLPGQDELSVVVLNVFEEFETADEGGQVSSAELYEEESVPDSVDYARERLEAADVETTVRHEHGEPAETIIRVADDVDANTIVTSGRRRSPTGKVLFGSTTQSVLLSSDRPVLVSMSD